MVAFRQTTELSQMSRDNGYLTLGTHSLMPSVNSMSTFKQCCALSSGQFGDYLRAGSLSVLTTR